MKDESHQNHAIVDEDKVRFERIHQLIVDRQLFLDPTFSREKYIRLGCLNKNKVAAMIKRYAGTDLTAYINGLRLDYALQRMKNYPDEPLKAIAANSGFATIRTFYRLFVRKFGMTPKTYRESL